ncbi:MAG TPA: TIGR02147 family protein, partial [Polyangiaceae bacterium]|nr:TIGR02147 family protein [Polyangiaceae bacterium]
MAGVEVDVFQFQDYREFLRAYYAERKTHAKISYRAFSRRAGLGSPNYLKLVMDGARNLSPAMAGRFAAACRLEGAASAYFTELVAFNQARSHEERDRAYQRMKRHARFRAAHRLTLAQDRYHSRWYYPAIRELVSCGTFREDPAWIA